MLLAEWTAAEWTGKKQKNYPLSSICIKNCILCIKRSQIYTCSDPLCWNFSELDCILCEKYAGFYAYSLSSHMWSDNTWVHRHRYDRGSIRFRPGEHTFQVLCKHQQIIANAYFLHKMLKYAVNKFYSSANLQQRGKKHIISKNTLCTLLIKYAEFPIPAWW